MSANPLFRERDVHFFLYEMAEAEGLLSLPAFAHLDREGFDLFIDGTRRMARELLYPAYKPMDEMPPRFEGGAVYTHPRLREIWPELAGSGLIAATRPREAGGEGYPVTVATLAAAYAMAANLSAYGYLGLTGGAGHLIEAFGSAELKARFLPKMYAGEWTGTMALTEPQAGSSLADVTTRARPTAEGHYLIDGAKIFISGGDHDLTDNIVHLVLARIDGAPAGTRGISLFAVPKKRLDSRGTLQPNDVATTGLIHKIGWRGLPSLALAFGEDEDCHGYLVGEPHRGLAHMFQMMNEARLMVGINGIATASVAYHEALAYARTRKQGRRLGEKDPARPAVSILEHADVRRMLLRQKAIVEGGLALIVATARFADLAAHAEEPEARARAELLLDLLTPIAKSFPSEWGFEANVLAIQVHGGYGYSSEYPVEAWMRDQKLNSLHEGTTGIQSLDLLGRKVVAKGGAPLMALGEELSRAIEGARAAGVDGAMIDPLAEAWAGVLGATQTLGARGLAGDAEGMLAHSADYLAMFSIVVVAWQWLVCATLAKRALARTELHDEEGAFYRGKLGAAAYWMRVELPRVALLAESCVAPDLTRELVDAL